MTLGIVFLLIGVYLVSHVTGYMMGSRQSGYLSGYAKGRKDAEQVAFAKHSAATRKGHANRKARKVAEGVATFSVTDGTTGTASRFYAQPIVGSVTFPRPLGTERLPHGDV